MGSLISKLLAIVLLIAVSSTQVEARRFHGHRSRHAHIGHRIHIHRTW